MAEYPEIKIKITYGKNSVVLNKSTELPDLESFGTLRIKDNQPYIFISGVWKQIKFV